MKIENDKYYTPIDIANHCWDKTMDIIGADNISEIIEPSCGNGAFYNHSKYLPNIGYDIDPNLDFFSRHDYKIITADFLKEDIKYLSRRLVIGNPPYGRCLSTAQKFFRKSVNIADYIAFILPISQLNNMSSFYMFDLIYSEDLGVHKYSDRELHCCFNIYARPRNNILHKKPITKLTDISIHRQDSRGYADIDYDIRMCYWGNGGAGKILKEDEHYSAEYKIKINNADLKDKILDVLNNFDWKCYLNCIAMRKIQQFHIVDVLRKEIPEIK